MDALQALTAPTIVKQINGLMVYMIYDVTLLVLFKGCSVDKHGENQVANTYT